MVRTQIRSTRVLVLLPAILLLALIGAQASASAPAHAAATQGKASTAKARTAKAVRTCNTARRARPRTRAVVRRTIRVCATAAVRRDRSAPKVSLTAPGGQTVSGSRTGSACAARASDNVGVRRVTFTVDGQALGTDSTAPYNCAWDTRAVVDGTHTVRATAYDAAGNSATASVQVNVDNVPEPTPAPAPAPSEPAPSEPVSVPAPPPADTTQTTEAVASFTPVAIVGRTYYVSPEGSDSNSGTAPDRAWRTVAKANAAALAAGDGVLFQGGATFSDATLMPSRSGTLTAPVVFGSYGTGRAILGKGIWLSGVSHVAFQGLAIRGVTQAVLASGSGGGSDHITLQDMAISDVSIAVNSANPADDAWTIRANTIERSGDSALIIRGNGFEIAGNTILDSGIDASILYGKHGIYLKGPNARVVDNVIRRFQANGVSARYRNATIERNTIADGPIGIAWFQNDTQAGTSSWRDNRISGTTGASIYVDPGDSTLPTKESFAITGNTLSRVSGKYLDLHTTSGAYVVSDNTMQ